MSDQTTPESKEPKKDKTFSEKIEVAGNQLVEHVKELIKEGNVRRLILRDHEGKVLMEIPLTTGVVVGGVITWAVPLLAALGALAALVARVKIEIIREEEPKKPGPKSE